MSMSIIKKIPTLALLLLLAVATAAIPLACSSNSNGTDGPAEKASVDMTSAG